MGLLCFTMRLLPSEVVSLWDYFVSLWDYFVSPWDSNYIDRSFTTGLPP